jgi:hypothetical protein
VTSYSLPRGERVLTWIRQGGISYAESPRVGDKRRPYAGLTITIWEGWG